MAAAIHAAKTNIPAGIKFFNQVGAGLTLTVSIYFTFNSRWMPNFSMRLRSVARSAMST